MADRLVFVVFQFWQLVEPMRMNGGWLRTFLRQGLGLCEARTTRPLLPPDEVALVVCVLLVVLFCVYLYVLCFCSCCVVYVVLFAFVCS